MKRPEAGVAVYGNYAVDLSDGHHLDCGWSDCWKRGLMLYRVRIFEGLKPEAGFAPVYSWKLFCSERHKQLYINAPRSLNKLPPGYRLAIG